MEESAGLGEDNMRRHVRFCLRGLVMAIAVVTSALGFLGSGSEAQADDPEPCGFIAYGVDDDDTTTSHTIGTYCQRPCGSGVGAGQPYTHVGEVEAEAFVCVRNV